MLPAEHPFWLVSGEMEMAERTNMNGTIHCCILTIIREIKSIFTSIHFQTYPISRCTFYWSDPRNDDDYSLKQKNNCHCWFLWLLIFQCGKGKSRKNANLKSKMTTRKKYSTSIIINMHSELWIVIKWRADNYWLCIKIAWNLFFRTHFGRHPKENSITWTLWTVNGTMQKHSQYNIHKHAAIPLQNMYAVVLRNGWMCLYTWWSCTP